MKTKDTFEPRSIMIIDDNAIDSMITSAFLKHTNIPMNLKVFNSAIDSIAYFRTLTEEFVLNNPEALPDVIFLDINMPIMDGFGFLEELNQLKISKLKSIRICFVSASCNLNEIDKAKNSGEFCTFFAKPLNPAFLSNYITN